MGCDIREGRKKREAEIAIITMMNEGGGRNPCGDHSVTDTGFSGPNFIIMTHTHQHTPSDEHM